MRPAHAQQECRNLYANGPGQICRQSDGTWAEVNPAGAAPVQEPVVSPSLPNSGQQPTLEISDCVSFGQLIKTTPSGDLTEALNSYFHTDLTKEPDDVLSSLVTQANSCSYQHPANEDGYVIDSLDWAYTGASDIQDIENANDAAVEAVAQSKQNAIDEQKNAALIADIPSCDNSTTITNIEQTVANSPAGKTEGLELLGLKDFQDVSGPQNMGSRVCNADALFNNGERNIQYRIYWFVPGQLAYGLSDLDGQSVPPP